MCEHIIHVSDGLNMSYLFSAMKSCELGEIGRSESFQATSAGKDRKSCELGEIGHSKSFRATSVGKDWKSCESGKIGRSESFRATCDQTWLKPTKLVNVWSSRERTAVLKNGGFRQLPDVYGHDNNN